MTNPSGTVVERYKYTPYGAVTVLDPNFAADSDGISDIENTHFYTGRELDPETGLQLNRNRFYASHLGRWQMRDPIEYRAGMNLFRYTGDSPVDGLDPFGLRECDCDCSSIYANSLGEPSTLEPINSFINQFVNLQVVAADSTSGPIGFEHDVYDYVAANKPGSGWWLWNSVGNATEIEAYLLMSARQTNPYYGQYTANPRLALGALGALAAQT